MPAQAFPPIILLGFLFGSTLVVSRFSLGQFAPTTYISLRLLLAGLAYAAMYAISRRRISSDGQLWRRAAVFAIIGTVIPMTAIIISLQFQSSGIAAILLTTNPAITVLLAHFFLPDEPLSSRKVAGVVLALGGALLLAVLGESGLPDVTRANPLGYGLVLLAMITGSVSTIYARKYMSDLNTLDVASVQMWVAALVATPLSLLFVGFDLSQVTIQGYAALGYAALAGTFTGVMLAFYNIQRFGATASAMSAYVIPIVATIGGVALLHETFTPVMLAGMALIIAGIALINQSMRPLREEVGPLAP